MFAHILHKSRAYAEMAELVAVELVAEGSELAVTCK
jgi:hypothetical protein